MVKRIFLIIIFIGLGSAQIDQGLEDKSKIAFTPHNFFGPENLTSGDSLIQDYTLCRQCHTPSKMEPVEALWHRKEVLKDFELDIKLEQKYGEVIPADVNSRSCLFCHDGSMAPGFPHHANLTNPQVSLFENRKDQGEPNRNLHLFSFPSMGTETHRPRNGSSLSLNETGDITCVTCHDPHNNEEGSFLRVSSDESKICFDCHEMANWDLSTHGNPADPRFSSLNNQACATCHNIHAVPASKSLLNAEQNSLCFSCHDADKDSKLEIASDLDLEQVFEKPFIHPIRWNSKGFEQDGILDAWSSGIAGDRGVSCSDCHNPHAASDQAHSPLIDGSQNYVAGIDSRGFPKTISDYEYETCYKCHGMNQNAAFGKDIARLFSRTNKSFHPIEAPGNSPYVPSLKSDWSEQSMLQCSDCHGNDDALGPQGPHGSNIPHILKASYADFPFASLEENQLCFKCHEEQRVVRSNGFKFHQLHIEDAGYACSACHNPHGSIEYPGLMDLSAGFIEPVNGVLEIVQSEPGHGTCTLKCHDKSHPSQTY